MNYIKSIICKEKNEDDGLNLEPDQIKWPNPLDSAIRKLLMVLLEKNIKLESTFSIFDVNNEEIIDKKQFIAGLKSIGLYSKMYPIEIDALFGKFDTNGSECVTEHEFYFFIKSCNMSEILKQIKRNKA